jgi:L-threonylcarbamoyladenylate synthase
VPLAAPSANPFGYVSPTTADHVQAGLARKIRYILDGGPSRIGVESTIVDLRDPAAPRLLRPGAITRADLERVLKRPVLAAPRKATGQAQVAPGLLSRHYSPRTPAILHDRMDPTAVLRGPANEAWIFVAQPKGLSGKNIFWLDARGDLRGAARRLFAVLRRVDESGFKRIHLERVPGEDLADAINDRLERAAARR